VDWNNDGRKDLVVGVPYGHVQIYLNTGTDAAPLFNDGATGYTRLQVGASYFDAGMEATPDIVDWDNDGDWDVLCGEKDGYVNLLINDAGPGAIPSFPFSSLIDDGVLNLDVGERSHPVAFDWNYDGRKDLLVGDENGYVRFYENKGTDSSPSFNGYSNLLCGTSYGGTGTEINVGWHARPEICDWNSDGTPDLAVGAYDGRIRRYLAVWPVVVDIPDTATEGDGTLTGIVSVAQAPGSDLELLLTSSRTSVVTVAASVTIAAGQTNAPFALTIVDDAYLDGTQAANLRAVSGSNLVGWATVRVHDNESSTLTLALPASATEGDATLAGQGTVSAGAAADDDVEVALTSMDTTEIIVPASATIAAGETSATFTVTVVDDGEIDGTQTGAVSAHVEGWIDGGDSMIVHDNETMDLGMTVPESVSEGGGVLVGAGFVSISGTYGSDLSVSLLSDDISEITVPVSVTIPQGESSAVFDVTVMDDLDYDGMQSVTVSASAPGFVNADSKTLVVDNEIDHFLIGFIPSPQTAGATFDVTIDACDINGSNAAFTGSVQLSAAGDSGPVTVQPTNTGAFLDAQWTGGVSIFTLVDDVWLIADDGITPPATSSVFDVTWGPLHHFEWGAIATQQMARVPFGASATALDAYSNVIANFAGAVALQGWSMGGSVVIAEVDHGTPDAIEFVNAGVETLDVSGWQVSIYDNAGGWPSPLSLFTIPAGSICPPGGIFVLEEYGTYPGTYPFLEFGANINWTRTSRAAVLLRNAEGDIIDFACFSSANPSQITNPTNIPPEQWQGSTVPACSSSEFTYNRAGNSDNNSNVDWQDADENIGTENPALTAPFLAAPVSITPTAEVAFVSGSWSGVVAVMEECASLALYADDGGSHFGASDLFAAVDDSDYDGMPDYWEMDCFGSITNSSGLEDSDSDGLCDLHEYVAGTDPTNALSTLRITDTTSVSNQWRVIKWQSCSGRVYDIELATNLAQGFVPLTSGVPATPAENTYTDKLDVAAPMFYRITVVE